MQVTSVSVNVRYSKQMNDGNYKTVELGVEGSLDPSDDDWQEMQSTLYRQLGDQMRYVFSGNGSGKTPNGAEKAVEAVPVELLPGQHHPGNTGALHIRLNTGAMRRMGGHGIPVKWAARGVRSRRKQWPRGLFLAYPRATNPEEPALSLRKESYMQHKAG
jgi:hypothetical protein